MERRQVGTVFQYAEFISSPGEMTYEWHISRDESFVPSSKLSMISPVIHFAGYSFNLVFVNESKTTTSIYLESQNESSIKVDFKMVVPEANIDDSISATMVKGDIGGGRSQALFSYLSKFSAEKLVIYLIMVSAVDPNKKPSHVNVPYYLRLPNTVLPPPLELATASTKLRSTFLTSKLFDRLLDIHFDLSAKVAMTSAALEHGFLLDTLQHIGGAVEDVRMVKKAVTMIEDEEQIAISAVTQIMNGLRYLNGNEVSSLKDQVRAVQLYLREVEALKLDFDLAQDEVHVQASTTGLGPMLKASMMVRDGRMDKFVAAVEAMPDLPANNQSEIASAKASIKTGLEGITKVRGLAPIGSTSGGLAGGENWLSTMNARHTALRGLIVMADQVTVFDSDDKLEAEYEKMKAEQKVKTLNHIVNFYQALREINREAPEGLPVFLLKALCEESTSKISRLQSRITSLQSISKSYHSLRNNLLACPDSKELIVLIKGTESQTLDTVDEEVMMVNKRSHESSESTEQLENEAKKRRAATSVSSLIGQAAASAVLRPELLAINSVLSKAQELGMVTESVPPSTPVKTKAAAALASSPLTPMNRAM